jgi:uncharacterized protein
MTAPRDLAIALLQATSLSDEEAFVDCPKDMPGLTIVDYHRIACRVLFECERCGNCCTTGDPIRLKREDAASLARHLKMPLNKFTRKYTIPDPKGTEALAFKKTLPCKFFDFQEKKCKAYSARPWSCRIFPFLGIYGSEGAVKVHESCPGSVKAMRTLEAALEEVRSSPGFGQSEDIEEIRRAKAWFNSRLDELC